MCNLEYNLGLKGTKLCDPLELKNHYGQPCEGSSPSPGTTDFEYKNGQNQNTPEPQESPLFLCSYINSLDA